MLQPALLLLMLVSIEVSFPSQSEPEMLQVSVLEGSDVTLHCSAGKCWSKEKFTNSGCYNKTVSDNRKYLIETESNGARILTIYNIQRADGGTYRCYEINNQQELRIYNLAVIKGCERDLMNQTDFTGNDVSNHIESSASACRENCTQSERCKFFTFVTTTGICYLKASNKKQINVTLNKENISGYSLRNCSGVVLYPAKKYHLVSEMKNWTDAQAFCRLNYTDLAIISTEVDRNAVQHQLELQSTCVDWTPTAWIGLYRDGSEDPWKWSDGVTLTYLNWENGYDPNQSHQDSYHCAISVNSSWHPLRCDVLNHYVCEFVSQSNGTTKMFKIQSDPKNKTDAADACRGQGGVLASILNHEEQRAFDEVTLNSSWIGIQRDSKKKTEWNWLNKRPFEVWGNSMVKGKELCAKLNSESKWRTEKCSHVQKFLCFGDENPMNEESGSPSTISTVGPPTSSSSHTPPGYLHYYNTSTSWINALVSCEANNRSLVHITNDTVQQHVTQLLDQVKLPQGVWIGLERAVFLVNSSWVWTSGQEVQNYTQWHKDFHRNHLPFHCGKMIRDSNCTLKWLHACCHEELPFICQDLNH